MGGLYVSAVVWSDAAAGHGSEKSRRVPYTPLPGTALKKDGRVPYPPVPGTVLKKDGRVPYPPLPDTAPKKVVACRIRRCRIRPRKKWSRAVSAAAGHGPEKSGHVRYEQHVGDPSFFLPPVPYRPTTACR